MSFLGQTSENNLRGVHQDLVRCVRRAIALTSQDFQVFEGLRTHARQAQLYKAGASRTMNSRHLDGDAVDLVPVVDGRLQWQMPLCYQIAIAMREAAMEFGVRLRSGMVWDRELSELDPVRMDREVSRYFDRFRAQHPDDPDRHPLIDGPHFERLRP